MMDIDTLHDTLCFILRNSQDKAADVEKLADRVKPEGYCLHLDPCGPNCMVIWFHRADERTPGVKVIAPP